MLRGVFFTKQNVKKFSVSKLKNALVNIRKLALDSHKEPINYGKY